MKVGIVGHESAKFTDEWRAEAFGVIGRLLERGVTLVSGGCHLGGVDVWAEEAAHDLGLPHIIHRPKSRSWSGGYKERNLLIARDSDVVHVIVVRQLPADFVGLRHALCYHCDSVDHVKSGACWTAREAMKLGKPAHWHLIPGAEPTSARMPQRPLSADEPEDAP